MKKLLTIIISLVLTIGIFTAVGISASAETTDLADLYSTVKFPDDLSLTTDGFGIDTATLLASFPENLESSYENGIIKLTNPGVADAEIVYSNNETRKMTLSDDYWTAEMTEAQYNASYTINFIDVADNGVSLNVKYITGSFDEITVSSEDGELFIYPYNNVTYPFSIDFESYSLDCSNHYNNGNLDYQRIMWWTGDVNLCNYYNSDGTLKYTSITDVHAREDYYYIADYGWSASPYVFSPGKAYEPYKDYTEGQLMELVPSYGLCAHRWVDANCQGPKACSACGIIEGNELNPDNHASVDLKTGLCGCGQQLEARIGDTPYATFADAFAAAKAGDTVVACTGKSGGTFAIPENAIFDGGEHEFSAMLENRGEIIGGKYTGNITNYGKITDGTYESLRYMIYNTGEIAGGVFDIIVEHHTGRITGGSFLRSVTVYSDIDNGHFTESATVDFGADEMGEHHSVINGGIFDCDMLTSGKIIAGTFNGQITNKAEIYGGTFSGKVTNSSTIIDGIFNGEVTNYRGKIYGGEFNAKVTNGVLDENGALAALGHIYGGSFNSGILNNEKSLITNVADDYTFTLGESFVMTNVGGLITCEEHFKASDATCAAQAVCRICGSYGELTDHTWADATCESPKTCSVCKATEGEALGHDYIDATTESPKTCKNCGATDGEPLPKPAEPVTPDEPAEANWFVRIWNAILDFFRRLFGIEKRK